MRAVCRLVVAAAVLVVPAVLVLPAAARAQDGQDEFALERFELSLDRDGILDVDSGRVADHLGWNAAAWLTGVDDPLVLTRLSDGSEVGALVEKRLIVGLGGAVALWRRVQLGVSVPLVLYQTTSVPAAEMPAGSTPLPAAGAGDVRLVPKVRIVDQPGRLQLALLLAVTAPLGAPGGYLREDPTLAPEVAASTFLGDVHLAANAGYRLRGAVRIADRVADDELFLRAGASWALGANRYDPTTEIALTVSAAAAAARAFSDPGESAVAVLLGGTHAVGAMEVVLAGGFGLGTGLGNPDWRVVAAVRWRDHRSDLDHDGVQDLADGCPTQAEDREGVEDGDGCRDPDDDGDGIPDVSDQAPRLAEDVDGFEDGDGVPDLDNDGDAVADAADRCPLVAETKNGFEDDDGCPDELPAALSVQVVSADGVGVGKASVRVTWQKQSRELEAGDDGVVPLVTLDGPQAVTVAVSARGYEAQQAKAVVARALAPTALVVTLTALPHGTIRGFIRGYDGKAVAASIRVEPDGIDVRADDQGFFELDLPPGAHEVVIEARGFAGQKRTVRIAEGGVTLLNVDLKEGR